MARVNRQETEGVSLSAKSASLGPGNPGDKRSVPAFGVWVGHGSQLVRMPVPVQREYSAFYFTLAGSVLWESDAAKALAGPETLVHLPAGLAHTRTAVAQKPVEFYLACYRPGLLEPEVREGLKVLGLASLPVFSPGKTTASSLRSIFREMLFEQEARRPGWRMALISSLQTIAVRAWRLAESAGKILAPSFSPGSDSAERVAQFALTLRTQFHLHRTLASAAKSVGLSERRFSDLFTQATGQSWSHYLQSLRLEHATKLLVGSEKPVLTIALESGFEDLSHFHHVFKARYQRSPLNYRKECRSAGHEG